MSDVVHGAGAVVGIAKAQARARIDRWLNEYAEGVSDRRAEAIELAEQAELERAEVEARFADAEGLRAEALKAKPQPYQIVRRKLAGTGTGETQAPKFDLAKALDAEEAKRAKRVLNAVEGKFFRRSRNLRVSRRILMNLRMWWRLGRVLQSQWLRPRRFKAS